MTSEEIISDTAAVVLAGGLGTRIRHLLPELPKPMAPVAGRPFVEWVVRYLAAQGITKVVISAGYRAEVISAHFAVQPVPGTEVLVVCEEEPLGTAGGFHFAAAESGWKPGSWLVLNGDSLVYAPLKEAAAELVAMSVSGLVLGVDVPDASRYGSLEKTEEGRLIAFAEKRPGAGLINAGIYWLKAELLELFPEKRPLAFERDLFPGWLQAGIDIRVARTSAAFLDIGTPESLPQAEAFIAEHLGEFVS